MITISAAFSLFFISATCFAGQVPRQVHLERWQAILSTVNCWRCALCAKRLIWSEDMAQAAANTGQLNSGGAAGMNHHAPPGTAEVIAPGSDTAIGIDLQGRSPFEISFIAWICEKPSSRMGDACSLVDLNNQNAVMPM